MAYGRGIVLSALFCLSTAPLAMGCARGRGHADTGDQFGTEETLVSPVTVTLAAPNPLSPVAPVLEASNSIQIGSVASISGTVVAMGSASGGVNAGPEVALQETATLDDVWSR